MNERWIELETEGDSEVSFGDVLSRIHTRPKIDCQRAWEVVDDIAPGDMTDIINQWTTEVSSTVKIFHFMEKYFGERGIKDPQMLELMALAVEYRVRENAM